MAGYIGTQAVSVNTTSATISDDLAVGDDATITGDLDVDGTTNLDVVDIDGAVDMASTLQVDGVATFTATPIFSDDIDVRDNLILKSDAARITFGADSEVILTHLPDNGIQLNTSYVMSFRDSAIFINSPADGDLDITADDEIELNSTLIDINGNVDMSGTLTVANGLTLSDGNLVVAAGHGIDFSADEEVSGAASEILDDYEEGTWTPAYIQGSNSPADYAVQNGYFTRIGNIVHVNGYLTVDGLASMSGTLLLVGLPYVVQNVANNFSTLSIGYYENLNLPTANTGVMGYFAPNTLQVHLRIGNSTASSAAMTAAQLSADGGLIFQGTYRTLSS